VNTRDGVLDETLAIVVWMRSLDLVRDWRHQAAAHRDDDAIVGLLSSMRSA
jgi:hypothetical protein